MSYCLTTLHKYSLRISHNHHYAISSDQVHPSLLPLLPSRSTITSYPPILCPNFVFNKLLSPICAIQILLNSEPSTGVCLIHCRPQTTSSVHRSSEVRSQESPSHSTVDRWLARSWAGSHSCCGMMTPEITSSPEDTVLLGSSLDL